MLTVEECRKMIFNVGLKFGVSPKLISTMLLSKEDKDDMLHNELPIETLECAVRCWMDAGMPDYANGKTEPRNGFL